MKKRILYSLFLVSFIPYIHAQQEQHRPLFHFTPPAKWMNDPNGMVYYKGEYHLFYQYYPDSTVWGPMHWGHAISKDLVHWEHLPIALYPDSIGCIFSGSAVVDEKNTSGFGKKGGEKPLVAIFTYHNFDGERAKRNDFQTQGIAYSLDKGRTWTKYANNPVIKNEGKRDFRDPKVFWNEASKEWVLVLAVADHIEFYTSKNLKEWTKTGDFGKNEGSHGGVWECPDLFPLKVEGTNQTKWVLIVNIGSGAPNGGSGGQYFVGNFDGKTFKNDNKPTDILWLDYGTDNYATVTWANAPKNKRISLGWMSNWQYAQIVPTKTWRSAMTLPRELSLKNTAQGIRLVQKPVKQAEILRGGTQPLKSTYFGDPVSFNTNKKGVEIYFELDISKMQEDFTLVLNNNQKEYIEFGFEKTANRFYIDRTKSGKTNFEKGFAAKHYAPRLGNDNILKLNIFIDVASIEIFADEGLAAMTDIFFPNEDFNQVSISSKKRAYLKKGKIWYLKP